jgi:uncharacterized protein (TIGR03437 family)
MDICRHMKSTKAIVPVLVTILSFPAGARPAQHNRITARVDNSRRAALKGHLHPLAQAANDEGPEDSTFDLPRLSVMLKPSEAQQAELDKLLAEQQDPASPNYHKWLTPEEYADRFGVSQDDMDKITAWLQSQNFSAITPSRARNSISFSGHAADVRRAFAAEIHRYRVDGEEHFASATEPSIPAALQGVVRAVHGLHDFRLKPKSLRPQYTSGSGNHYLAPDDIATIFNVRSLYNSGIDGSGQKLVVVGQTQINLADIQQFRTYFNLPGTDPQVMLVPNSRDPGMVRGDSEEANLDLQWSGAVARGATIVYVYAQDVMDAVQYAIDQNLAPVLSMSYGLCESQTSNSDAGVLRGWAKQANAQGMTWFAASGDAGGADCFGGGGRSSSGLSVDIPASIPEVTGVGGTQLNDAGGTYWNSTNDANHASALSYIPETAWNDSTTGSLSSSGGGASRFFDKPSWQTGAGVPSDTVRDVPDVALPGSPAHSAYLFYTGGKLGTVGGTSAGAPVFAGIATLMNHYLVSNGLQAAPGVGNMNPRLYALAAAAPHVFHDVTTGNNIVTPCSSRTRTCTAEPIGYNAGPGYDQVTGLGSVDAYSLVTAWHEVGSGTQPAAELGPPAIASLANGASFTAAFAPGMVLSVFGTQLAPRTESAAAVPLPSALAGVSAAINGVAAPLYYVSANQLNIEIPYEIGAGPAVLRIDNNGQSASTTFAVSSAAPGIFTNAAAAPVPHTTAARGQVVTLYLTGAGAVTGGSLPRPAQTTAVTVGGLPAPIQFIGIPAGLAGVVQINYQVPGGIGLGMQPVVVTVGGVSSAAAQLNVTR